MNKERTIASLITGVFDATIVGSTEKEINGICLDSREIQKGDLFVALPGTVVDGHQFIDKAVLNGATSILCQSIPKEQHQSCTYIQVPDVSLTLQHVVKQFFNDPSSQLKLVGITGTNGKTTIATLLFQLFTDLGYHCGLISTIQYQIGSKVYPSTHTTPNIIQLNKLLSKMKADGCTHCFMEVSSHAVAQNRIGGLTFAGGIFTNLSHDHLDYHGSFDAYLKAKKTFFDNLPSTAFALTNLDDKRGMVMLQNTNANKQAYSLKRPADFKGKILENTLAGLYFQINGQEIYTFITGQFNASNLLAVYGTAHLLGENSIDILVAISKLKPAEGRFDVMTEYLEKITAIVDYAHTPDALEKILSTIQEMRAPMAKIITVVGCGGDRDRTKRPIMAQVALKWSDKVLLTSDNPRTEDPQAILNEMQVGMTDEQRKKTLVVANRREAINAAVMLSNSKDILLIAGKGHEKYQEINGVKHPFDDKEVLRSLLS